MSELFEFYEKTNDMQLVTTREDERHADYIHGTGDVGGD